MGTDKKYSFHLVTEYKISVTNKQNKIKLIKINNKKINKILQNNGKKAEIS